MNISGMRKDIARGRTPFFFALRGLSDQQQLLFTS